MRFPNFVKIWDSKKFQDIFFFLTNNTLSRDNLNYDNGNSKNIHYGDILIKYTTLKDIGDKDVPFVNKDININSDLLYSNDVIIADTAEDFLVGKAIEIVNDYNKPVYSGLHTIPLRPIIKFANGFVALNINSYNFRKRVHPLIQGIKVYSLSKSSISKCNFCFPEYDEQLKISDFLLLLEDRISTQKKIISNIESHMIYIKNKIYNSHKGKRILLSEILFERKMYSKKDSKYEHVTLSKEGIMPKTDRYDRDFLVMDENKEYKITMFNDLCYNPANLKFGVICQNKYGDAIFSPIYVTFDISKEYDPDYVCMLLTNESFIKYIRKFEQGTVYERMAVNSDDFLKAYIYLPEINIQKNIMKCINKIEEKLSNEKRILELYQKQKDYLLNKLFI